MIFLLGTAGVFAGGVAEAKPLPPGVSLGISGTQGEIFQPDPKRPGKYIWKIWAQGGYGLSTGSAFDGTLSGVTAVLFQKGAAAAQMKAPTARYYSEKEVVVASGRVTVVSLIESGTTLVADTVTWYYKTNQIVATGNVVYHNGKTGLIMRVPRFNADTVLKSASFGIGSARLP